MATDTSTTTEPATGRDTGTLPSLPSLPEDAFLHLGLLVHGDIGDTALKIQLGPRADVRQGDTVQLGVDERRLHLFGPATGEAFYHSDGGREAPESRSVAGAEANSATTD